MRKIQRVLVPAGADLFEQDKVELECGHETHAAPNAARSTCKECAKTDVEWRKVNLPKLQKQVAELTAQIASDNEKWKTHSHTQHTCDDCMRLRTLQNILTQ